MGFIFYSLFFALFNILRALSGFSLTFFVFLFFFCGMFFLFFIFLRSPKLFDHVLTLIFSDFVWRHKKLITFGMTLMRDWPFVFGIYAALSLSSFYLIKEYPDDLVCYFFNVGCVSFRNICLLPYLGYGFMLKINQKKVDLLAEKGCVSNFPLFSNTSLLENKQFYRNVQNWADLVSILKPSIDSSKKLSLITTPTSFFWILYPTLKKKGSVMIMMSLSNIEDIELKTFPILHNKNVTIPQDWLLKKLAFWITEHARLLNETVKRYQEMNPLIRGLYFTLNPEEAKTLLAYSFKLLGDSRELAYCFQTKLECQYSHEVLIDLTKKYLPEFLPEVTQNLSVIPQNFGTENGNHVLQKNGGEITESHHIEKKIFTSKEDSLEFLGVLKKFFFF